MGLHSSTSFGALSFDRLSNVTGKSLCYPGCTMGGFRLNMVSSHLSRKSGSLAAGFPFVPFQGKLLCFFVRKHSWKTYTNSAR